MKILFCDDEIEQDEQKDWNYKSLIKALKKAKKEKKITDYSVAVARTGNESHEMLLNEKFDGVILDIQMPVGETPPDYLKGVMTYSVGSLILEELVKKKIFKLNEETPVVIFTGTAVSEVWEKIDEIIAERPNIKYMIKPKLMRDVLAELMNLNGVIKV